MADGRKDFFISYNSADSTWAEWIGHVLEDAGYSVIIQAWDFRPGSNFVLEMQQALAVCERMIAVLSPSYLQAQFPQPEWAAAFAADPEGARRALVPVMVKKCEPRGLLAQIVQIRIHEMDGDGAARALINGVKVGRGKPSSPPVFPGAVVRGDSAASMALRWSRVNSPVDVVWRAGLDGRLPHQSGYEAVELHLVPVGDDARLQVAELALLADVLAEHGRRHKLFSQGESLVPRADSSMARVVSNDRGAVSGIAVTRGGQHSAWLALPRGSFGALLDEEHLRGQLRRMIQILATLPIAHAGQVVPFVAFEPASMISIGKADGPPSNTASFGIGMPQHVRPDAEDMIEFDAVDSFAEEISAELVARLVAAHRAAARLL